MKIHDVTSPIFEGMAVYKNKPEKQPKLNRVTSGYVTESKISMDLHTGTHIDAPLHMVTEGETFETIPVENLIGQAKVLELTHVEHGISKADLENKNLQRNDFVIFKTKNSLTEEFDFDFIFLAKDGAEYLAEIGIRGVGIDALGVERAQEGHPTHKTLFAHNIIVIEGLRLKEVNEGEYFMVAAPLKMVGTDAAPARVFLFEGLKSS
jgi:arylformamidase